MTAVRAGPRTTPSKPSQVIGGIVVVPENSGPMIDSFNMPRSAVRGNVIGSEVLQWVGTLTPRVPTTVRPMLTLVGTLTTAHCEVSGVQSAAGTEAIVPWASPTCVNVTPTVVGSS